jgi:catechol 2,3-dioxygenase-like lactoylglutathione lyase family enzyme
MLTEVRLATLGVGSLERAIEFYAAALDYRCESRGMVDSELANCWGFDALVPLEWAVLAADASGLGRLRLLARVDQAPLPSLWTRANARTGVGYFALNFRAQSVHACRPKIIAAGGSAPHAPSFWEVSEQVSVWDSISQDPDGIRLDIFSYEKGAELRGPLETPVSVLQTVALASRQIDRSVAFYQALGFQTLFDRTLNFPELAQLLDLDGEVEIRNVNLMKDGSVVPGRVEMFCHSNVQDPEHNLSALARPGAALGILAMSFEAPDIAIASAALQRLGARKIADYEGQLPGFEGQVRMQTLFGVDQERLELIQRLT